MSNVEDRSPQVSLDVITIADVLADASDGLKVQWNKPQHIETAQAVGPTRRLGPPPGLDWKARCPWLPSGRTFYTGLVTLVLK